MLMVNLTISCLTTSDLLWFMDLTFQVPMQYCSLQRCTFTTRHIYSWASFLLWPSCFILSGAIIIQDTCREIKRFTTQKNVLKSVQVEAYWKNTFGRSKGDYWVQKKWFGLAKCRRHGVWYSVLHDLSSYLGHDCCDCGLFSQKKEQKMLSDIRSRNIWI